MYFSRRWHRCTRVSLIIGIAVVLSGCWTPPSASVRPTEPHVIERGISVARVLDAATVVSVDPVARTIGLSAAGTPMGVYEIGPGVHNWGDIRIGDLVHAQVEEVITVYVAPASEHGGSETGARSRSPDARVLAVDPSYRLLTVQYPNGERETFKIALHTSTGDIEAGDFVSIRQAEVVELRVRRHSGRQQISRSRERAAAAR